MLLVLTAAISTSCLARRRAINNRKGGQTAQALLTADSKSLVQQISMRFNAIESFNATVDMVPALGNANKGKITEYKDVRAYILFRNPSDIRIIGTYPVVRSKAFDMVSDGSQFQLYIPSKNRFVQGRNQIEKPSANKLENLRPQHFLEALRVQPIDPNKEKILLENFTDEENAFYILQVIEMSVNGQPRLERQVWFDRLKLQMARQIIFDAAGDILTDARYSNWQSYDNVPFPKVIEINRPKDEYGVVITVVKMDINKQLTDDKFKLERPEGTELQIVGSKPEPPAEAPRPPAKKGRKKK